MSPTDQAAPIASSRAVTRIISRATDDRRANERFKGSPVHRGAVDYLDPEARRPRRLSPSSYEDECDYQAAAIDVVEAWQAQSVAEGPPRYRGIFGVHGVATLRTLVDDMQRNGDGRSDLAYSQMASSVGQGRGTVWRRYHDLIDAGIIDYQPRSISAGADGRGRGLRVQMSSVAWLTPDRLPPDWRRLFNERLAHHRERRAARDERRAAAERRRLAQERMQDLCAEKAERARDGGTPRRKQRAFRTFDPVKVNPAAMRRLADNDHDRAVVAAEAEQRDAARVAALLPELLAAIRDQCG